MVEDFGAPGRGERLGAGFMETLLILVVAVLWIALARAGG